MIASQSHLYLAYCLQYLSAVKPVLNNNKEVLEKLYPNGTGIVHPWSNQGLAFSLVGSSGTIL